MEFLDSNILLYSISRDPNERNKQEIAEKLLLEDHWVISTQVLGEFYKNAVHPKAGRVPVPMDLAKGLVKSFCRFRVVQITSGTIMQACELHQSKKKQFWDSVLIATAAEAGCAKLITEDIGHDEVISGVRIVDPFR